MEYIGCIKVSAKQITIECAKHKGYNISDKNKHDRYGYEVKYPDGHVAFCPKDIFEKHFSKKSNSKAVSFGVRYEIYDDAIIAVARTDRGDILTESQSFDLTSAGEDRKCLVENIKETLVECIKFKLATYYKFIYNWANAR
jgi:hypothetical protein